MRQCLFSLSGLYLVLGAVLSWGAGFAPAVPYPVGHFVCSVRVGDFNNDGILDIMAGDKGGINVLVGNGDGTFQAPITTTTVTNAACSNPTVADFNLDGKLDVALGFSNGKVQVFLGNGDGTFQGIGETGTFPVTVPSADFNGDGTPDLLLVDSNNSCGALVVLGNGDGTFRKGSRINVTNCIVAGFPFAVGDFNGDGHQDVLLVEEGDGIVIDYRLALGKGDGTFRPTLIRSSQNNDADYFTVADLNHDGTDDLVLANDSRLGVQFGSANGTFPLTFPEYCDAGDEVENMAMGDFNADSIPDVVMAPVGGLPLMVGLGQSGGKFRGCKTYDAGPFSFTAAVGDFNGDGAQDIVAGNFTDPGTVSVLIATRGSGKN